MNREDRYERQARRPRDRSNFGGYEEEPYYEEEAPQESSYRRKLDITPDDYAEAAYGDSSRQYPEDLREFDERYEDRSFRKTDRYGRKYAKPDPYGDEAFDEREIDGGYGDPDSLEPFEDDLTEYDEFGRKRKPIRPHTQTESKARVVWGWILSIIAAIAIAFVVRTFLFEIIMVDGASMQPTLETDERLAVEKVSRYFGLPERGDIIIVHYPGMDGTYVKRVIALPGETVEVKDSTVYINGQAFSESYINPEPYADMEAVTVPEDTVFVMGDNRAHSLDSRTAYIGPIDKDEIVGHAMFVIWPFNNIHSVS